MDADQIAALRAQAKSTGGDWISLTEVGDWFAGTVADPSHQTVKTEYGETEELLVEGVTINDQEQGEGVMTLRLSRHKLRVDLGTLAENTPGPGWSVFVTYTGLKTSKNGRDYHNYNIAANPPDDAQVVTKKAMAKLAEVGATADADIPF